ncbi:hypothetical protein SLEP1_g29501 [Rubroshorea leprosula]|uniref:Uncharacterized protein n=1 Tax=Rubroshorea leprosula TaxID=152421 RepID=A0AAV5JZM0_9ROSI|nr:hypothetical protein SLEP1_g29501 [Rubroshorea leprosula]
MDVSKEHQYMSHPPWTQKATYAGRGTRCARLTISVLIYEPRRAQKQLYGVANYLHKVKRNTLFCGIRLNKTEHRETSRT